MTVVKDSVLIHKMQERTTPPMEQLFLRDTNVMVLPKISYPSPYWRVQILLSIIFQVSNLDRISPHDKQRRS